jgi:transmembrane sensor
MADLYDQKRLEALARKYLKGTITAEEQLEFDQWFADTAEQHTTEIDLDEASHREALLERIHAEAGIGRTRTLWPRIAVAASLVVALSFGAYFLLHQPQVQQTAQIPTRDIAPGRNQATLTLANGHKIILTKGLNGKLAQQGQTTISVHAGQAITYVPGAANPMREMTYNTLTTQRGEQSPYPLILPDGSKVMLNAASSITFPTAFTGKDRMVKITGEAYFEVVHNAAQPFRVTVRDQTIEDIGTAFNINAYNDEPVIKTTLVQGLVRVSNSTSSKALSPGQQARVKDGTSPIQVLDHVDTEVITAWTNGYFRFDQADLPAIMREFSRWYDVYIVYEGSPKDQQFNMKVARASTLKRALHILTVGGIHYRLDGKKLIINP